MRRLPLLILCLVLAACSGPDPTPTPIPLALAATPDALPLIGMLATTRDFAQPISTAPAPRLLDEAGRGGLDAAFSFYLPPGADLWSAPLALDGLALIVHPTNPLSGLSLSQVREVFTGRVNDWSKVGGGPGAIETLSREDGADLRQVFVSRALEGLRPALTALVAPGTSQMLEEVARNPQAIGYAPYARLPAGVKALAVEGVKPSPAAFESGAYPLTMPLWAIAPTEPAGELRDFLIWVQSAEGQAAVLEAGKYGSIRP